MPGDEFGRPIGESYGLANTPRTRIVPVCGSTVLLTKSSVPLQGELPLDVVGQPHPHLHFADAPRLNHPLADHLPDAQQRRLLDVEVGIHRIDRHDRGQERGVGIDQVARRSAGCG